MPSTIQSALGLEAFFNAIAATPFTFFPEFCLAQVVSTPIAPVTTTLLQVFGTMVYTLTVPLLLCIPDSPHAAHTRRVVYYMLGAGEAFLVALLLQKGVGGVDSGFSGQLMLSATGNFVALIAWRGWVLWVKPEWLEPSSAVDVKRE